MEWEERWMEADAEMGIRVWAWGRCAGVSWRRITASNLSSFWPLLGSYLFKSLRLYSPAHTRYTLSHTQTHRHKQRHILWKLRYKGERKNEKDKTRGDGRSRWGVPSTKYRPHVDNSMGEQSDGGLTWHAEMCTWTTPGRGQVKTRGVCAWIIFKFFHHRNGEETGNTGRAQTTTDSSHRDSWFQCVHAQARMCVSVCVRLCGAF